MRRTNVFSIKFIAANLFGASTRAHANRLCLRCTLHDWPVGHARLGVRIRIRVGRMGAAAAQLHRLPLIALKATSAGNRPFDLIELCLMKGTIDPCAIG